MHSLLIAFTSLVASAAASADSTPVLETAGCAIYQGADVVPGIPVVTAECAWPEVDFYAVRSLLGAIDGMDELFWTIERDTLLRWDADRALVHHLHVVPGIRAREGAVWMRQADLADGGWRVSWETAHSPVDIDPDSVRIVRNDGSWEVHPLQSGGVRVAFDLAYAPGGEVPAWLVRWVQHHGAAKVLSDLRDTAGAHSPPIAQGPR